MNTYIQPQPIPPLRREGLGCFGKGCLILCLLILFLLIACAVGVWWGMKRHPELLQATSWAARTHLVSDKPTQIPAFDTTEENIAASKEKWKTFDQASRHDEAAQVELSADDLNNLIAANKHARGKAFVTIEGNRLQVKTSIPLTDYLSNTGLNGYYLNGEIAVESKGPHSLETPNLEAVTVNGKALPATVLDWQYRERPLRDYLGDYEKQYRVTTAEIRDGKLILSRQAAPAPQQ